MAGETNPDGRADPDATDAREERDDRDDLRAAVRIFLEDAEQTYEEYDRGYADADATLRVLRSRIDDLRRKFDEE